MARRDQSLTIIEGVNQLLFTAWERGARHVVLQQHEAGIEIHFLGVDGREHTQYLTLPYEPSVQRLRQLSASFGRVRVNLGGEPWQLDVVTSDSAPKRVFLHMRRDDD